MPIASGIDKRRFYRHPVSTPIQYQEVHNRTLSRTSSVDMSQGGICFLAEHFLAKGIELQLSIPVCGQLFRMKGRVAYCNRVPSVNRYRTGVAFSDSVSAFHAKLAEQMNRILEYRNELARESGQEISEEDAARAWIEKFAKQFSCYF